MKKGKKEGRQEGIREGIKKQATDTAKQLLKAGVDLKIISLSTGLTLEEIKTLI